MNVKVADLMAKNVITTTPHKSIEHVKDIMKKNHISAVPVVNAQNEPLGVVTTSDFSQVLNNSSPVSTLLKSEHLYQIPQYNSVDVAAKMMRNHKIHHLLVTHEAKLVGLISSFDLLKLLSEKKFVMKNPPQVEAKKT